MNSRQLWWILSKEKVTGRTFKGVYALDEIEHIKQREVFHPHILSIWIRVTSLECTGLQYTSIGKDLQHILILLDIFPQEKSKTFCTPMQKAGTTIMSLFKNFISRHVDNLLCFIFIKDVLV